MNSKLFSEPNQRERSENAISGTALISSLRNRSDDDDFIVSQILSGNIPTFLKGFVPIRVEFRLLNLTYFTTSDYISIGSDQDYVRMPVTPIVAQMIANELSCLLPTKKMVDQIWKQSVKLNPQTLPPNSLMTSHDTALQHNNLIDQQLKQKNISPIELLSGHKKDIIISNKILQFPKNVVIYGWHKPDGNPIQPLNAVSHSSKYYDYSHGMRLISRLGILDGTEIDLYDLLKYKDLVGLISDEGTIPHPYYNI